MSEIDYEHDGAGTDTTLFELTTQLQSEVQTANGSLMVYLDQPDEDGQDKVADAHTSMSKALTELVEFAVSEESLSTNEKIDLLSTTLYNDDIDRVNFLHYTCKEEPGSILFKPFTLDPDKMRELVANIFVKNEDDADAISGGVVGLHINLVTSDVANFFQSSHVALVTEEFKKRQGRKQELKFFAKTALAAAIGSAAIVFFAKKKS